jgi:hypothetical protein
MSEGIDQITVGVALQTPQWHGTAGRIAEQAFQLISPVRGDLGVGVQGKPVDTGTTGTGACGMFPCIAKPRAKAPDLLAGPLPKGDALLDGGRYGTGQLGGVIDQRIIPRGQGVVETHLQIPEVA